MERCRFCNCMKSREFCENIFDNKQTNPTIPTIVELFTNLKIVEDDPYTRFICFDCFHILIIFYHYRERVLETNQLLRNEIENKQNNVEDFHKKWPRIEESDDGQFVVYKIDSDNGCKMNLQIGNDSKDIENQCNAESFSFIKNEVDIGETCLKIENDFNDDEEQKIYENNYHLSLPIDNYDVDNKTIINDSQLNDNNDFDRCCSVVIKDESRIEEYPSIIGSDSDDEDNQPLSTLIDDNKKIISNNNNENVHDNSSSNIYQICSEIVAASNKSVDDDQNKRNDNNNNKGNNIIIVLNEQQTGGERYQCNICEKMFLKESSLKRHLLRHTGEKRYQCDTCDKMFLTRSELKRHLLTHTGEKRYQCKICNKHISNNTNLQQHLLIHTGVKAYQCNICDKKFTYKVYLKKHVISVHTGERPYQCDFCNKRFSLKTYLNQHLKTHTYEKPHQCSICDKKFRCKVDFNRHLTKHADDKSNQCSNCNKLCVSIDSLCRHERNCVKKSKV